MQITIGNKTHVFSINNNKGSIVPSYRGTYDSRGYSTGAVETKNRVARLHSTSSELQKAIKNYRQVPKNTHTPINTLTFNTASNSRSDPRLSKISQNIQQTSADVLHNELAELYQQKRSLQAMNTRNKSHDFGIGGK